MPVTGALKMALIPAAAPAIRTARCASVTPLKSVMSIRSYLRSARSVHRQAPKSEAASRLKALTNASWLENSRIPSMTSRPPIPNQKQNRWILA